MNLYSYPSTHGISGLAAGAAWEQFEVCLKLTIKWSQRCTWRLLLSECGDALGGHHCANLVAVIERVWRLQLRDFWDTLGGHDWVNIEIHLKAMIARVWRCTWWPWSGQFRDALGGRDRVSMEMHLDTMIVQTWRPGSSKFGGRDWASLEMHLDAVDGRLACCWVSIH